MAEEVSFIIRARNLVGKGVRGAIGSLNKLKGVGARVGRVVGLGLKLGIGAGIAALVPALGILKKALDASFTFEKYTAQFAVLFKDTKRAKQHMVELAEFSASTPFQIGDIAQASRSLHVFTDGVLGGTGSLRLIGDAAAAVGTPIADLSMWVGRAYGAIKAGRPFGEAAMRLMELGVLTPKARAEMERLQKSGASAGEVFAVLQGELGKFEGGMKVASETGDGLSSTLKDNMNVTLAAVGDKFRELAKDHIKAAIEWLQKFRDTKLDAWAENVKKAVGGVVKFFQGFKSILQDIGAFIGGFIVGIQEKAAAGGGGVKGFIKSVAKDEMERAQALAMGVMEGDMKKIKANVLPGMNTLVDVSKKGVEEVGTQRGERKQDQDQKRYKAEQAAHDAALAALHEENKVLADKEALTKKIQDDLAQAERDRVKIAMAEIKKLAAADKFAVMAMAEARKKGMKGFGSMVTGAQAEALLKFVKKEAVALGKKAEQKSKRVAAGREKMAERLENIRLQAMTPMEQLKARSERAQGFQAQASMTRDPEERLKLQGKFLDEQAAMKALAGQLADDQVKGVERTSRAISLGEAFDISRGDITKRDPQEDIRKHTETMARILAEINQKGGLD